MRSTHLRNLRVGACGIEDLGGLAPQGWHLGLGAALARRHEAAIAGAGRLLGRVLLAAGALLR